MADSFNLGELEHLILLAVLRLDRQGYAVTIREELEREAGRSISLGAIYVTLERLERKGLVRSWFADPTPERGGKAKRYYAIEPRAIQMLGETRAALMNLWRGLNKVLSRA
jgi:PadR family transcriptional regulator, regulatory protein PadR